MKIQKNNKNLIIITIFVTIFLIICILFATETISLKPNNINNSYHEENNNLTNDNNPSDDDSYKEDEVDIQENKSQELLILEKETETFNLEKLNLEFKGIPNKEGKGYFNYTLNIKYDGKNINNDFFNDKKNYRIWSTNMTGDFRVYKIDNVYILKSFIAKQCFGDEIMIFNTNGEILKTFTKAEISIDGSTININISDNGQCMGEDYESHITKHNYKVNGLELIEQ